MKNLEPKNRKLSKKLPETPGVYLMKDKKGRVIYIGKAGNLRRRVTSYFQRAHDYKTEKLVNEIRKIDYKKTDSALEALILESKLIKQYEPKYNVLEKDDKSFLYVEITKEEFPRVLLVRGREIDGSKSKSHFYGPFVQGGSLRETINILRKIFPYNTHTATSDPKKISNGAGKKQETMSKNLHVAGRLSHVANPRPCLNYQIGLCPGICVGAISRKDYRKTIANLKLFFEGKKKKIIKNLEREMKTASRNQEYEKAAMAKRQIFAIKHIQDIALLKENGIATSDKRQATRIEGFDISNISGTSATGSMVVFRGERPDKNGYRRFRIQNFKEPNDIGMLKEVLRRRLKHREWPLPDLVLIDGGAGQVNAARAVFLEQGFKIPVIGIAKGARRKKNEFVGLLPIGFDPKVLIQVRDEAHRFAISYHRKLRGLKLTQYTKS